MTLENEEKTTSLRDNQTKRQKSNVTERQKKQWEIIRIDTKRQIKKLD